MEGCQEVLDFQRNCLLPLYYFFHCREYDDIVSTPLAFARKFRFNDPVIERIREDIIFGPLMAAGDSEQFEQWAGQAANVSPPQA
jgi:hypothetical protein